MVGPGQRHGSATGGERRRRHGLAQRAADPVRDVRRLEHTQATDTETWTLRHDLSETALPLRRAGAFTPGTGVGGSSLLYGGMAWRFPEYDFIPRTAISARYGTDAIPDGATIQDWGISYADLAPFYDQFERTAGVGGRAGNINGRRARIVPCHRTASAWTSTGVCFSSGWPP